MLEPTFEFWDDHHYEAYGPRHQQLLSESWSERPRPQQVIVAGGKYVISKFDEVEFGYAFQVNTRTEKQRHVRMKPPYCVAPSSAGAVLPSEEFHFQYRVDEGWRCHLPEVQRELAAAARSRPPPARVLFDVGGRVYQLQGLQTLLPGGRGRLSQLSLRTGKATEVRLASGPAACPPERPGGPEATPRARPFRSSARFQWAVHAGGCREHGESLEEATPEERAKLLESWLQAAPPALLELPGGTHVEGLGRLELGGAVGQRPAGRGARFGLQLFGPKLQRAPLELVLPPPQPGCLTLPDDLDDEGTVELSDCGRRLTGSEIAELPARGTDFARCAICLCEHEPHSEGAVEGVPVLELLCGHVYHVECIKHWFQEKRRCPQCQRHFGKILGTQPRVGRMCWHCEPFALPGHPGSSESIVVDFHFPAGLDDSEVRYRGRKNRCYLPGNAQGIILLELFQVAFRRRVMFGLGHSLTTEAYKPTFNIHIKTSTDKGATSHGYPDHTYFERVMEELHANGVTRADLPI